MTASFFIGCVVYFGAIACFLTLLAMSWLDHVRPDEMYEAEISEDEYR